MFRFTPRNPQSQLCQWQESHVLYLTWWTLRLSSRICVFEAHPTAWRGNRSVEVPPRAWETWEVRLRSSSLRWEKPSKMGICSKSNPKEPQSLFIYIYIWYYMIIQYYIIVYSYLVIYMHIYNYICMCMYIICPCLCICIYIYIQCSVIIQIFCDLPCNERRFFTRFHLKSKALHSMVLVEHWWNNSKPSRTLSKRDGL